MVVTMRSAYGSGIGADPWISNQKSAYPFLCALFRCIVLVQELLSPALRSLSWESDVTYWKVRGSREAVDTNSAS